MADERTPFAQAKRINGKCWSCGKWVYLRKNGTLGTHRRPGGNRPVCDGSGLTPGESGLV